MKFDINEQEALARAIPGLPIPKIEKPDPTISTMHEYTRQEIFDFVVSRVIKQGVPAMNGPACVLLNEQGHRCAVGMLVPDANVNSSELPLPFAETGTFLGALVTAHDLAALEAAPFLPAFRDKARGVALRYQLDPAVCEAGERS